eukprot:CAMPEP_0177743102 /NCGR_PEP_ID=MMETSP0484_2-20121128/29021_1 /TAXON_ID=354590 /ORGANISM="Rhodomonas lens, Strain RHODO" /LENGTH=82 /DNA_ID=CAMNT_0019257491 /DNA_START=33 /DNA_END=277 /DNA_ORIENTATION=-
MAEHERGKDSVIWLDLGQNYRLKATAEEHLKPPQLHDGEAPHGFEDTQVWLQTMPANKIDHKAIFGDDYVPDSAGKLLTYHV